MALNKFLAIDLGAESGRAVAGSLEDKKLVLKEIHRFPTRMLRIDGHYFWNIYRFYEEIINGINLCVNDAQFKPESLGIDTWGVDFGIVNKNGKLNNIPYGYRDPQTVKAMKEFHASEMDPSGIYQMTGIAMQPFNSLYHLYALSKNDDSVLKEADRLLLIPDLLNYLLTGVKKTEFTNATTTQLYNPAKGNWETELFEKIGISAGLMTDIVKPGVKIGMLKDEVAEMAATNPFPVVSVCSHDTGSAIVAVPAEGEDWAYISSGTWSLMGVELNKPILSETAFKYNFTNEGGAEGTFRFLKNIMGLWLVQQCRNSWLKTGYAVSYAELVEAASTVHPFKTFIDPDDPGFYNPGDMPEAITEYCRKTGQTPPSTTGEFTRTIMEGLAFKYRMVLDQLRETTGKKITRIHIIGGGTQNKMLCQFTANVTGCTVYAGPAEGTAAGNILIQARAAGVLESLKEMRDVVKNSFEIAKYKPENTDRWEDAYAQFLQLTQN